MTTPMTSMRSVEDLKPCPFCGGADFEICRADVSWVDCATCGAEGPWHYTPDGADDVVAIAAWNTRQSLAQDTGGWQDISTAPKDGKRRMFGHWFGPMQNGETIWQQRYGFQPDGFGDTHWCDGPAAPTPKGSEAWQRKDSASHLNDPFSTPETRTLCSFNPGIPRKEDF